MSEETSEPKIDLYRVVTRILRELKRTWIIVLALAAALSVYSYIKAKRAFVPRYESKALFKVSFGYNPDNILSSTSVYDNTAASQLAAAFPNLISTDVMRDLMLDRLGKPYINGYISARSFADSNLMLLTVRSTSPDDAYSVLCAVIDCYPQVAAYMTENPNIIISEAPSKPVGPYNSFSGKRPAAVGAAEGIVLGMIIVAVIAFCRKTITSTDELKAVVNLPILAAFPKLAVKKRRSGETSLLPAMQRGSFAEATRDMRITLKKRLGENDKIIMVTGTLPGEGKTTVSVNLARTLAEDGARVVLVDGDLHRQDVACLLGEKDKKSGLADFLDGGVALSDCISVSEKYGFSYVSGSTGLERLYSADKKKLAEFFGALKNGFDYVIVDTPPCGVVSDSSTLCRYADGIIYVVKEDYARRTQILDAINGLSDRDVPIIGCVVNGISGSGRRYGYGYGYKYGYGYRYGYGYGYKKRGYGGNG